MLICYNMEWNTNILESAYNFDSIVPNFSSLKSSQEVEPVKPMGMVLQQEVRVQHKSQERFCEFADILSWLWMLTQCRRCGRGEKRKNEQERSRLSTVESARGRLSSARTSDFCSQLNGRRKLGRVGEEERRKRQPGSVTEQWWRDGEEGRGVRAGGSLNLLLEEVWRERIREDREGSVSNLTAMSLPTSAH